MNDRKALIIVGGGIAGLSAAWYAQQQGIDYALLEASGRWGGKIRTEIIPTDAGDIILEHGPDSFITQKPWALHLAHELGLAEDIIGTDDAQRSVYVLNHGKLRNLPDGMMLIVPTRFLPFATSRLISPLGKLRMGREALIPARTDDDDESLADFVRRRLGDEALDKLAEPLMSGIYNTDPQEQSLLATFPRFRRIEQDHGSLTRGMFAARRQRSQVPKQATSLFVSFRHGMESLVETLVAQLTGELRLRTPVQCVQRRADGYTLQLADGTQMIADQVLLALPAYAAAAMLSTLAPTAAASLHHIHYVATGTMNLVYRKADVDHGHFGSGVVIPRSEQRHINAITVSSNKFAQRVPEDLLLLRVFFGGARTPHTFSLADDALETSVRDELRHIFGITAAPLHTRIARSRQATAQYHVGHLDDVAAIEAALPPGLTLTGSAYYGVGLPDCVHQAAQTVAQIAAPAP